MREVAETGQIVKNSTTIGLNQHFKWTFMDNGEGESITYYPIELDISYHKSGQLDRLSVISWFRPIMIEIWLAAKCRFSMNEDTHSPYHLKFRWLAAIVVTMPTRDGKRLWQYTTLSKENEFTISVAVASAIHSTFERDGDCPRTGMRPHLVHITLIP